MIIQQPKSAINLENGPNPEQSLKEPPLKTISDTDPRPSRRLPTRKSSVQSTYGWIWYVEIKCSRNDYFCIQINFASFVAAVKVKW